MTQPRQPDVSTGQESPRESASDPLIELRESIDGGHRQIYGESLAEKEESIQIVVFALSGESYGVPIENVREILRTPEIGRIPRAPQHVRGVINVRGQIIPVVDMHSRLGSESSASDDNSRILIVELDRQVTGLLVDGVSQVTKIASSMITPVEEMLEGGAELVGDFAHVGEQLIILLDLGKVLRWE